MAMVPQFNINDSSGIKLYDTDSSDLTINSDSTVVDSLNLGKVSADTLKPIFKSNDLGREGFGSKIKQNQIRESDYRYTGNFITLLPFGYLNDLGSMGAYNESLIYGFGFDNISFLSDDITINNKLTNSLDLHLFPSESIDSIVLSPLSRGFLYNTENNPVALSAITKDRFDFIPYTRIRYHQGPTEEGFIDAMFSAYVTNRLNVSVQFSNMSRRKYYANSDYGNWTGTFVLHYMLSNKINILAHYRYNKVRTPLNGGINIASIHELYPNDEQDEIFYDNISAPVNYLTRYQKQTAHSYDIQFLSNIFFNQPSTLTFYYHYGLTEFRQNENNNETGVDSIINNHSYETYGIQFTQSFRTKHADIEVRGNYENIEFITPLIDRIKVMNNLSVSGIAGIKIFNSTISPNIFAKYLVRDNKSYFGFGADISLKISNSLNLYGGISGFAKPFSVFVDELIDSEINSTKFYIIELGLKVNTENADFGFTILSIKENNKPFGIGKVIGDDKKSNVVSDYFLKDINRGAFNISGDISTWKLNFTNNFTYYFSKESDFSSLPEFTGTGGLYYSDILFDSSLRLKTGITYYLSGETNYFEYDFEKSISYAHVFTGSDEIQTLSNEKFDPTIRFDYLVAGTIRESATLYFLFENILGTNYFLVPYYPMQSQTFRLGVTWELFN